MIYRRNFLQMLGTGLATVAMPNLVFSQQTKSNKRPPNIIFILADDLGWGDLGCYGHPEINTTNLDRLAAEGTLFTQYYVASPVCSPSRVSLMTGRCPGRMKILIPITGNQAMDESRGTASFLDPQVPTLTRLLKDSGYVTGHFGKWHIGIPDERGPGAYGVDEHKTDTGLLPPENRLFPDGAGPRFITEANRLIVDAAIQFINKHRDQPFYLNLWTPTPHIPLYPTDEQMAPYTHLKPGWGIPYPGAKQVYYGSVTEMDLQFGRLLDYLDQSALTENTIIIFSSDNGPENIHLNDAGHSGVGSPGPFRGHKSSIYEGGIRVPFIVRWPGHIPAGRIEENAVLGAVDYLPTICKLAGVVVSDDLRRDLDGEDMSEALLGTSQPRTKPLFWENRFWYYGDSGTSIINKSPLLAIREGNWKLMMNPDGSRVELYDLSQDLSEVDNKASENPQVVKQLTEKLMKWKQSMPEGPKTIPPDAGDIVYPWPGRRIK